MKCRLFNRCRWHVTTAFIVRVYLPPKETHIESQFTWGSPRAFSYSFHLISSTSGPMSVFVRIATPTLSYGALEMAEVWPIVPPLCSTICQIYQVPPASVRNGAASYHMTLEASFSLTESINHRAELWHLWGRHDTCSFGRFRNYPCGDDSRISIRMSPQQEQSLQPACLK